MTNEQEIRERLFEMACSGDIENLDTYHRITGSVDVTVHKFGADHSLVMGALRNKHWATVRWLIDHGAKLTPAEQQEVNDLFREAEFIRELQTVVPDNGPDAP